MSAQVYVPDDEEEATNGVDDQVPKPQVEVPDPDDKPSLNPAEPEVPEDIEGVHTSPSADKDIPRIQVKPYKLWRRRGLIRSPRPTPEEDSDLGPTSDQQSDPIPSPKANPVQDKRSHPKHERKAKSAQGQKPHQTPAEKGTSEQSQKPSSTPGQTETPILGQNTTDTTVTQFSFPSHKILSGASVAPVKMYPQTVVIKRSEDEAEKKPRHWAEGLFQNTKLSLRIRLLRLFLVWVFFRVLNKQTLWISEKLGIGAPDEEFGEPPRPARPGERFIRVFHEGSPNSPFHVRVTPQSGL